MVKLDKCMPLINEDGTYAIDERYKEIVRLHKMLNTAGIPHDYIRRMDGWQVIYPSTQNHVCDAIEFWGTYGSECDMLEIYGLLTAEELKHESVCGYLSANDVFGRIRKHYRKEMRG